MAANVEDWKYRDLRERIDAVDKAWRERMNEVVQGSVKRLERMDADVEDTQRAVSKQNEVIATLMSEMKAVQTHIQNRLLWAVTAATVSGSLLSGFVGHIFFK